MEYNNSNSPAEIYKQIIRQSKLPYQVFVFVVCVTMLLEGVSPLHNAANAYLAGTSVDLASAISGFGFVMMAFALAPLVFFELDPKILAKLDEDPEIPKRPALFDLGFFEYCFRIVIGFFMSVLLTMLGVGIGLLQIGGVLAVDPFLVLPFLFQGLVGMWAFKKYATSLLLIQIIDPTTKVWIDALKELPSKKAGKNDPPDIDDE